MDLTILEALEITTQETKEYIDEQPVISYGETQFLNAASRMTAKNNVGVFVGSDEPANALDGDIWIDTDKNVGSGGGSGTNIKLDDTLTVAGMAADAKAVGDALMQKSGVKVVASGKDRHVPTLAIHTLTKDEYNQLIENGEVDEDAIYLTSDDDSSLPDITDEDNGAVLGVSDGEWNKVNLPITVSDDGYTGIHGLRQATSINMIKDGNTIVITTTYDGGVISESVITLDENDYPIAITTNGVECVISLEGFE